MRFEDIEKVAKQIRALERVNIRSIQSITKASQLNLTPLRQMDSIARAVDLTRQIPMGLGAITAQSIGFRREIERLTSAFRFDAAFHPALQSFAEITRMQLTASESLATMAGIPQIFEQSFIGTLMDSLPDAIDDERTLEEASETVRTAFKEKADGLLPSGVTLLGLVNLLVVFLMFWVSQQENLALEERVVRRIDEAFVRRIDEAVGEIIAKFEERIDKDQETQKVHYVAKQAVNVRRDRSTRSPIVGVLYRNQVVEVVEHRKKWIYVRYFDHIESVDREGWVYKKYTKRVPRSYSK